MISLSLFFNTTSVLLSLFSSFIFAYIAHGYRKMYRDKEIELESYIKYHGMAFKDGIIYKNVLLKANLPCGQEVEEITTIPKQCIVKCKDHSYNVNYETRKYEEIK